MTHIVAPPASRQHQILFPMPGWSRRACEHNAAHTVLNVGPCFGHGVCSERGVCVCSEGYQGTFCDRTTVRTVIAVKDSVGWFGAMVASVLVVTGAVFVCRARHVRRQNLRFGRYNIGGQPAVRSRKVLLAVDEKATDEEHALVALKFITDVGDLEREWQARMASRFMVKEREHHVAHIRPRLTNRTITTTLEVNQTQLDPDCVVAVLRRHVLEDRHGQRSMCLILPRADFNLREHIQADAFAGRNKHKVIAIMRDVALAIKDMHDHQLVHGDVRVGALRS